MSKFKNLVDQLRKKRLEGVISVDSAVEAKVEPVVVEKPAEKPVEKVAEEKPATETKVNSAPKPKQTKKRKGK